MVYCKKWELEDEQETLLSIRVKALQESMKGLASYLQFTNETGNDYADGGLPTLDTNLIVGSNNQILYKYYEKPTTTITTVRMSTAMAENPKMQCLANDLVRRLLNTKEDHLAATELRWWIDIGRYSRPVGTTLTRPEIKEQAQRLEPILRVVERTF